MKKSIVGLSVFIALNAYASDFNVIISKENNSYEVAKGYIIVTETTNWTTLSNICSETTPLENIYFGVSVNEDIVCQDYQERDKITKKVYNNGTEEILSTETESQYVDTSRNTVTLVGTHKEDNCLNIQTFDNTLPSGQYTVTIDSSDITVNCDMVTDGGGWTQVANVHEKQNKAVESSSWSNADTMTRSSVSHAGKYLSKFNPQSILFKNTSESDHYGSGDLIVVDRTLSSWNWTIGSFNDDSNQTGRFYDSSSDSWANLGSVTYSSHGGNPWQSSALSFTINNVSNGYSSNFENRLVLGATWQNIPTNSGGYFLNFYGNQASHDNTWVIGNSNPIDATGEVWMK